MNPLVVHDGTARATLLVPIYTWAALEVLIQLRSRRRTRRSFDWSFPVVVAGVTGGIYGAFRLAHVDGTVIGGGWTSVTAGLALLVAGVLFRLWAIAVLGRFFVFSVTIQEDHRVVTRGPYRFLRHPSYSGALVAVAGIGLALDNWLSVLAVVVPTLFVILVRIYVEEQRLGEALGAEYQEYAARTARLIPGIF